MDRCEWLGCPKPATGSVHVRELQRTLNVCSRHEREVQDMIDQQHIDELGFNLQLSPND
jgi:hypothetical protein